MELASMGIAWGFSLVFVVMFVLVLVLKVRGIYYCVRQDDKFNNTNRIFRNYFLFLFVIAILYLIFIKPACFCQIPPLTDAILIWGLFLSVFLLVLSVVIGVIGFFIKKQPAYLYLAKSGILCLALIVVIYFIFWFFVTSLLCGCVVE